MQWSFREHKLLFQMTRCTQSWDKLIPGPVHNHSTAPITRSMLWQLTGGSINQPAAVLSNSLLSHTHTHKAPIGVIADHHTWQLDDMASFSQWQVLNSGSKAEDLCPAAIREGEANASLQSNNWGHFSFISRHQTGRDWKRIKITALQPFPCSFLS